MSELLGNISISWLNYFGQAVIQNTLFLGFVLLVLYYSSSIAARYRYLFATIAMLKLVMPLFFTLNLPITESISELIPVYSDQLVVTEPSAGMVTALADSSTFSLSFNLTEILFFLWITGGIIYLICTFSGTFRLYWILRSARPLSDHQTNQLKARHRIQIYQSKQITLPLTHLFYPRRIYVPAAWNYLSPDAKNYIVQHELAHINRYDNWIKLLQTIVQALYFFHPLVWQLNKQINLYREMACDDASVRFSRTSHHDYSRFLTSIAEEALRTSSLYQSASAFLKQRSELYNRINYQIKEITMATLTRKKIAFFSFILLLSMFVFSWHFMAVTPVNAKEKQQQEHAVITVILTEKNELLIDGHPTTTDKFAAVMQKRRQAIGGSLIIELNFDPQADMKDVFFIQGKLQELNLLRVVYKDRSGRELIINLPSADIADKLNQLDKKDILMIYLNADGKVTSDKMGISQSGISTFIKDNLKKNEYLVVVLSVDQGAEYQDFVKLVEAVKNAGATRLAIKTSKNK